MGWFGKEDDHHFDPYAYEDEAWNDVGMAGGIAAVVIILVIAIVGSVVDGAHGVREAVRMFMGGL